MELAENKRRACIYVSVGSVSAGVSCWLVASVGWVVVRVGCESWRLDDDMCSH